MFFLSQQQESKLGQVIMKDSESLNPTYRVNLQ